MPQSLIPLKLDAGRWRHFKIIFPILLNKMIICFSGHETRLLPGKLPKGDTLQE